MGCASRSFLSLTGQRDCVNISLPNGVCLHVWILSGFYSNCFFRQFTPCIISPYVLLDQSSRCIDPIQSDLCVLVP